RRRSPPCSTPSTTRAARSRRWRGRSWPTSHRPYDGGVKFGVAIFPTDYAISMSELAPAAEDLGFESLWVAEHTHIPTSRESPWAGGPELPKHYWHTLDPFVALTAAALASKTIRIATGICLLIERDPIHTAKETASLDLISNGRFI